MQINVLTDSEILQQVSERVKPRFWSKVEIKSPDECWPWKAFINPDGYGKFRFGAPFKWMLLSSKAAWVLTYGEVPKGNEVCHKCDNPACCNPKHLFLGTHAQNMQDCYSKGRGSFQNPENHMYGEECHTAKLNPKKVRQIRKMFADGITKAELARKFGVTFMAITFIVRRINWKHVK